MCLSIDLTHRGARYRVTASVRRRRELMEAVVVAVHNGAGGADIRRSTYLRPAHDPRQMAGWTLTDGNGIPDPEGLSIRLPHLLNSAAAEDEALCRCAKCVTAHSNPCPERAPF